MDTANPKSRRRFMWGAAVTGAAATAAVTLPQVAPQAEALAPEPLPKPERGGGYRVSEHIERYYKTTRF